MYNVIKEIENMKKFIFALLVSLMLAVSPVYAQTWHTANQSTVAWDAVTTLSNGSTIPLTDVVKYKIYLKNAVTGGEPVLLDEVTVLEYVITLNTEGSYFIGVSALRYLSDGTLVNESVVAWSDMPEFCANSETFGVRYFISLSAPGGLRHQ